jgi:hypothetical protein
MIQIAFVIDFLKQIAISPLSALYQLISSNITFGSTVPGRAVRCLPAPPQIRTSGFPAYGSSIYGFAN